MEKIVREIYENTSYRNHLHNNVDGVTKELDISEDDIMLGYGETGFESFSNIINNFKKHFHKDAVFYDLGCGTGKIPLHVGLLTDVKKSCGIEVSSSRTQHAYDMIDKYNIDTKKHNISIITGSYFDVDISDATVIYFDNKAMSQEFIAKSLEIIPKGCFIMTRHNPWKTGNVHRHDITMHGTDKFNTYVTEYNLPFLFTHIKK